MSLAATLHTDGGARGNPGPAGIGVVLRSTDGRLLGEIARGIGVGTNNWAEYTALIEGLELALANEVTEIDAYLDSKLVVSQVRGEWKIKHAALKPLAIKAHSLLRRFERYSLNHVRREENADADALANQGMDNAASDPDFGGSPSWDQGSFLD
ncbi:MAG: ribonuclease HI family protein [Actinobacteria bacterium]|nr:ribonuclease HI family protein [Actinomycetota bacterium]